MVNSTVPLAVKALPHWVPVNVSKSTIIVFPSEPGRNVAFDEPTITLPVCQGLRILPTTLADEPDWTRTVAESAVFVVTSFPSNRILVAFSKATNP